MKPMKRVGVIGCGRIGGPLIKALQKSEAGQNTLVAVLSRQPHTFGDMESQTEASTFLAQGFDLIIDTATPESFAAIAVQALTEADVWTVNPTALADEKLFKALESAGRASGHRLRILHGAIAGLDGVSALAVDPKARVEIKVDLAPSAEGRKTLFKGSVRDAAPLFPDSVNVAMAAGLCGAGLENTQIEVVQPAAGETRRLGLKAESCYGQLELSAIPAVRPDLGIHSVTASIIAALRRDDELIWVG